MLHSNIFWFDGERIFWHTANVGRLRSMLDAGETQACFTITEQGRILPAGTPLDFSTEYASVIIYGKVRVAADLAEKRYGLEGLMTKYAPQMTPGVDYVPIPDGDVRPPRSTCWKSRRRLASTTSSLPTTRPIPARTPPSSTRSAKRAELAARPKELA